MSKLTKKIIFGIISLVIVIVSVIEVKTASEEVIKIMPITNKTIIVDAGHGGIDPGSMTDDQSVKEKDVNLKITKKVKELLEASGAMVILTRNDDTSLYTEQVGKTIRQKYN